MTDDNKTNVNEILELLASELGCDPLVPEEDGRILMALDGNLAAVLFPADAEDAGFDSLIACIVIGPAPEDDAEILGDLLAANYMGMGAGGGTLSIERETHTLVLFNTFILPLAAGSFLEGFADLVGAARHWRDRLEDSSIGEVPAGNADMLRV